MRLSFIYPYSLSPSEINRLGHSIRGIHPADDLSGRLGVREIYCIGYHNLSHEVWPLYATCKHCGGAL